MTATPDPRHHQLAALRPVLIGHCYRMLGSPTDADDAVQETMIRAIRGLPGFEGRASLKTWTLRIATHVCLDELSRKKRRERPMEAPPGGLDGPFDPTPPERWVEPVPDAWVVPVDAGPEEVLAARQSVRLAFVAALQHLPARQRAALLLTQVLGFSAKEAGEALDLSVAAINSALQRARARVAELDPAGAADPDQRIGEVADAYQHAFERFDLDRLVAMMAEDVTFDMPPIPLWVQGPAMVRAFLAGPGHECEGSVLVPAPACGTAAFAQYRHGGETPWGIVVLQVADGQVTGVTTFLDTERLFPVFGLPMVWG